MRAAPLTVLLILFLNSVASAEERRNDLVDHPSPYLAMHGQDPVHWQDWNAEVLEAAQQENRLILISSGYFACHWCHVMQRESYRNAAIAALLNGRYIAVKIDRELQPALDAYLIEFVTRTHGQAGWPLNVILTPQGYPLVGFTYLPPENFLDFLARLDARWKTESAQLTGLAKAAAEVLAQPKVEAIEPPDDAARQLRAALRKEALELADPLAGGFGQQNKFPSTPQLMALLGILEAGDNPELKHFLETTLDVMASQGLRDHLAGGFFRYTVDPNWQTPHFEKMLYTQAQMIELYLTAAKHLNRPDYREIARDTLRFLIKEFASPDGGYIASFSAVDGAGVEGGYYLWTEQQLQNLLSEAELDLVNQIWGMQGPGYLEAGHLPILRDANRNLEGGKKTLMTSARDKLLAARAKRQLPADDKVIAAWNGLVLSALALAVESGIDSGSRADGERLKRVLLDKFADGDSLRRDLASAGEAGLEDFAYVARGLADWARVTGDRESRNRAAGLMHMAWQSFYTRQGWRLGGKSLLPAIPAEPAVGDGPMPSPAAVLLNLSSKQGEKLDSNVRAAVMIAYGLVAESPFWYASYISAFPP
ncbi:MAG: thioredoxin domain-containing protein [Chromatiales bacterium]|nr:thioredoxin domain-containing protein [Chromatiales bacterium]